MKSPQAMQRPESEQSPLALLKGVSRSFYLTLRVLPSRIRPQIGLAYLLARTSDTIADTELVPLEGRLGALRALRARILGSESFPLGLEELARCQASGSERSLLERCDASVRLLQSLSPPDTESIQQVLETITSGQELDLLRFAEASPNRIVALHTDEELDDYTYRVAGCVGEFWTGMCRRHLFPEAELDEKLLVSRGIQFGKGLQLVNILRDIPADLRQGRCYLPCPELRAHELEPEDLLNPKVEDRFRPLYTGLLGRAEANLHAGWAYTNMIPRGQLRVRLACAWPILIGLETLRLLRGANVLDAAHRVKVSRRRVRQILCRSVLRCWNQRAWRGLVPEVAGVVRSGPATAPNPE